jgi:hypothetical protein
VCVEGRTHSQDHIVQGLVLTGQTFESDIAKSAVRPKWHNAGDLEFAFVKAHFLIKSLSHS